MGRFAGFMRWGVKVLCDKLVRARADLLDADHGEDSVVVMPACLPVGLSVSARHMNAGGSKLTRNGEL